MRNFFLALWAHTKKYLPAVLLLALFILILSTFRDYGITWDERFNYEHANRTAEWLTTRANRETIIKQQDSYFYGSFCFFVIFGLANLLPFGRYESAHLVNTLFGLITIIWAYRLTRQLANKGTGLVAAVFLTATPLFYGYMFNNFKDLPFACMTFVAFCEIFELISEAPRHRLGSFLRAGIAIGLALAIRLVGLGMVLWLGLVLLLEVFLSSRPLSPREFIRCGLVFVAVTAIAGLVMIPFWPILQIDPGHNLRRIIHVLFRFPFNGDQIFMGEIIGAKGPRYYLITWFLITLPGFVLLGLVMGSTFGLVGIWESLKKKLVGKKELGNLLVALFVSGWIISVIVLRPIIYDGNRHFLFLVPFLCTAAALGANAFFSSPSIRLPIKITGVGVLIISFGLTLLDMVQLHPYQSIYFNRVIAGGLYRGSKYFETDYWGQSYKEGMEWVIQHYARQSGPITVYSMGDPEQCLYWIGKGSQTRHRFTYTPQRLNPRIILATTRGRWYQQIGIPPVHIVKRKGVPLLYVFDRGNGPDISEHH